MGPVDFLILAAVAVLFFFALRHAYRHRNSPCGGDCSTCPYHRDCTRKERK